MEKTKKRRLQVSFESTIPASDRNEKGKTGKENSGSSKGQLMAFIAIASIPLVMVLGNSMLVPILPTMMAKMGISRFQSSMVITLFSFTAAIVIPISGFLSDRFSRKSVIIPSLILYGGAGILAGFAVVWHLYWLVIVARALQGIGAAGTAPIAMAYVGDIYSGGTESKALGLTEASNGTGKVVSPILGSLLALWVWYAPFFAFPLFCLISLLLVMFVLKEPKKNSDPPKLGAYLKKIGVILKKKGRWLITAFFAGSLALFILFGVLFYLSNILEEPPYSISDLTKGFILAVPLLGMVVTSYTTGALIKKNGTLMRRLMNIGLVMMTVALALTVFLNKNLYVFIGLLTLSSIGTGLVLPCLNTMITGSVEKSERGMITSLYSSLRFLGVAAGPPLFGWLMEISHQTVFITVSALSLIALGLTFFLIKPKGKIG